MWLTDVSIRRPVFILMIVLGIVVLGLRSRMMLLTDLYPDINLPFVAVQTVYPGAGPEEVESQISERIEEAVSSVNRIRTVQSTSQEGISFVGIEFELGTNLDVATADIRQKIDQVRGQLPRDADLPIVSRLDVRSIPVLQIGVLSTRSPKELRDYVDNTLKDRLANLKGVASVLVTGGEIREIEVKVDRDRLDAYDIPIATITNALLQHNLNVPGGSITAGERELAVRVVGEFRSIREIEDLDITIPDPNGGPSAIVRLGDIAAVTDGTRKREDITRVGRQDSVGILIVKQSAANTVEVVDAVKAQIGNLERKGIIPGDIKLKIQLDQSKFILESIADVNTSLVLGALFAVLVVFLFLHNLRGTLIVAVAIPTSIIATFLPMYAVGFTLNMMSMLGLALSVGVLVDDSIVVLENIYRHLSLGEDPRTAALNGRSEIGLAAIAITLVDVVVFLPIAFMGEIVGQFFRQFGITIASAVLFSLFVSFTLTPMLASRLYHRGFAMHSGEGERGLFAAFNRLYTLLDRGYRRVLAWSLENRYLTIAIGWIALFTVFGMIVGSVQGKGAVAIIVALITAGGLIVAVRRRGRGLGATLAAGALAIILIALVRPTLGFSFFPATDQGQVGITVETPTGTSLAETSKVIRRVEDVAAQLPEVKNMFTEVGAIQGGHIGSGRSGTNIGQITLELTTKRGLRNYIIPSRGETLRTRSDEQISSVLRRRTADIPGAMIRIAPMGGMESGGQAPLEVDLSGPDLNTLNRVSQRVKARMVDVPGVLDPDVSWRVGRPEIRADVDRDRAAALGFSVAEIATSLRNSIEGNNDSKYRERGNEYDIRVQLADVDRESAEDVARIIVGHRDGAPVRLADVSNVIASSGPTKIDRTDRQRTVGVSANLLPGYPLINVKQAVDKALEDVPLEGVSVKWSGEAEMYARSMKAMVSSLFLAIILVYMLMSALYESMLDPIVIMVSLPQAMVGALLALILTGNSFSIVAMVGFIMLMGLVTKNAILLIDYTNTLRNRGLHRRDAVLEAGPTRLRPVLMTTTAMVSAMSPVALALGRGSEWRAPMAITVIGGLILSTMLTLLVVPTSYTVMDDIYQWVRRLFGLKPNWRSPVE
jgi:HAE1 family hydrophobic/amphiphilic exporter-1